MTRSGAFPSILSVRLYEREIGTLTHLGGDRMLFAFTENYIGDENRPTLSLGFKDAFGGVFSDFAPTQTRALPFFSNLLPEGHMRAYLAERARVNPVREFPLLKALGMDLPGAVTIVPAGGELFDDDNDFDARQGTPANGPLRFSLAGVQLKFSALLEARGGLTIPAAGRGGNWIIKLPSREFEDVPQNEFSMMSLAAMVGIDVPPVRLVDIGDIEDLPEGIGTGADFFRRKAFAIERFDRAADGSRVHIEDFAQVFGLYPEDKYKNASLRRIAQIIGIEAGNKDVAEFIRRLTFNVLIGNADMHVKNWSLIYRDQKMASLAPAYDFVSTIPYIRDENFALKFSRTSRFAGFDADELAHLAAKAELPEKLVLDTARETAERFHEAWRQESANLPLRQMVRNGLEAHLAGLPRLG